MIQRIVKFEIKEGSSDKFIAVFEDVKQKVLANEGCHKLCLWQDKKHNVFMTYSLWENEEALDKYRNSDYFALIWPRFKVHFAQKAQAWSLEEITCMVK